MMRRASAAIWRRSGATHIKPPARKLSTTCPTIQITTLPNKIRVVTDNRIPDRYSYVGLLIDAGSRYETPDTLGVSYLLGKLAFQSTANRSFDQMISAMDSLGGQIACISSRDSIVYQSCHAHENTPLALSLIADTVLNPSFDHNELEALRIHASTSEFHEMTRPFVMFSEILHWIAYSHKGLGNSVVWLEGYSNKINADFLRQTMQEWYRPEKMVIAGAGMPHDELVELTDKHFSSLKPSTIHPTQSRLTSSANSTQLPPNLLSPSNAEANAAIPKSTYTGGYLHVPSTEPQDHLYIAFEGPGIEDDDVYALIVMDYLLGGTADAPSTNMCSRLYTQVFNHYSQMDLCDSFHRIYTGSSLFGLSASFVPGTPGGGTPEQILHDLIRQLSLLLYSEIPISELKRAQDRRTLNFIMQLESISKQVSNLGRQILVLNREIPVTEVVDRINQVTPEDIRRLAARMFGSQSGSKATIVYMGHENLSDSKEAREVFPRYGVAGPYH